MTPQTEQQLIQALQQIVAQLNGINQKLHALAPIPAHLNNIAAKTGR